MPEHNPAVESAIEGELRLLDAEVRRSPERMGALLHPDFHEFGSSGRLWDRASVIAELTLPAQQGSRPITASRMKGVQLAPDVVHLTFDTAGDNGRRAHRSSLWRRTEEGWRLYFHQGTPFR
ncbi:nuclear transport factor 2 family protein [Streptomyces sp. NBC_01136]|uniref:nuclear transport factor 2 family protein n=1 Tax=unclassified Streptomyces TaxID=2593676 RepID=UPI00324FD4BF|nr:nuclear transport factor 2 family protein [Streptomyces sp. NBC_01136]